MKRNDATFKAMVARLQSGEITRKQACEEYDIPYGTLAVWLTRSKVNESIPRSPAGGPENPRQRQGAALEWGTLSDDVRQRMNAAVARVLAGETSALAESKADPEIKCTTLTLWVRRAKEAAGIPVRKNKSRYVQS